MDTCPCSLCSMSFNSPTIFRAHMKRSHQVTIPGYCPFYCIKNSRITMPALSAQYVLIGSTYFSSTILPTTLFRIQRIQDYAITVRNAIRIFRHGINYKSTWAYIIFVCGTSYSDEMRQNACLSTKPFL
ncbi:zinc finger C2H2 type [Echinococcus multilocularis]|uniref:Zinc finger C2H2 type n=1 Tax=Echinococcus multilocularis TaxID=6211 RepID=A0A068YJB5_ECHMU|nr:zinc finger C2H2 type [Echinococcus multilocularis]